MKLTMVVVFYQQKIEQSKTFSSLMKSLQKNNEAEITIMLYDNSAEKQEFDASKYQEFQISYTHDPRNLGIATAYNVALNTANDSGSEWLLLLDHDTELTREYLDQIVKEHNVDDDIVAIVPKVISHNTMISPVFSDTLRPLTVERPREGVQSKAVMAINSGSLLKVGFLNEIGGFNEQFPLDYLDHWLFYKIYAQNKKVLLLDVTLQHELSVMDYNSISIRRYKSILDAEMKFYSEFKKDLYGSYRKQLLKRLLKQLLTVKNKQIAQYTMSKLRDRRTGPLSR